MNLVDSPELYTKMFTLFISMAVGDGIGEGVLDAEVAEETPPYYDDIDVTSGYEEDKSDVTVEAKVEEEKKGFGEGPPGSSDTTGKVTVRYYDEETGLWVEAEVSVSDEKQKAGIRITKEF